MSSNKIQEYIKNGLTPIIERYQKQIQCEHTWERYGFGYCCTKCDYYSGLDSDLNELIKKQAKLPTNEQ